MSGNHHADLGNAERFVQRFGLIQWHPRFLMVLEKSAPVRARPGDAIRAARLRREGRSRIAELVSVELNRDHSIFDLKADPVHAVTFERHAVLDRKGRRWRYRDIIAAQTRYLREEADCEGGSALVREPETDLPVGGVAPEGDAAVKFLNDGGAIAHVVDRAGHSPSLGDVRIVRATEPKRKRVRT